MVSYKKIIIGMFILVNIVLLAWSYTLFDTTISSNAALITGQISDQIRKKDVLTKQTSVLEESRFERLLNLKTIKQKLDSLSSKVLDEKQSVLHTLANNKATHEQTVQELSTAKQLLLNKKLALERAVINKRMAEIAARRARSS